MGVPVLTTNNGSLMEIIENNRNGYLSEDLVDGNVSSFVKNLLNDNKKFKEISLDCLRISKDYDWKVTATNLNKIYEGLI
jgi:glycosyltransferase involved in cell wall biosynthesis